MGDSANQPNLTTTKPAVEADLSGRELGEIHLLRRLGRGAMAEVYLAEQRPLRRLVAVKVLKPQFAADQTYLRRFEREAQAAASLIHANIVQIYEVGCVDGLRFIAQEYVQGQNLREWLARHGPPKLPHALSIMRQVAAALAKAAEQGVVHRDIKPENIMLTDAGEVKVADFGLARVAREGDSTDLTQVGMTLGTPLYMSPEQVEGKPLDPRSDIYSFGVTCYQMLAGAPPFEAETALGVAVQHLKIQPKPLENIRPDLPPALCRLVHQMLAKNPEDRCQSAREILLELRRLYLEHGADAWPEELPGWQSTGLELPDDPRRQATQQLSQLMTTATRARSSRWARALFRSGLAACFVAGAGIAWVTTAEPSLLAGADAPPPTIPQQQTALQQYLYASRVGTPEAWQSVITYFPKKQYYLERAEQQLARIYLHDGKYGQAMAIFTKFAATSEPDESLRAFGLAGICGVLTLQGKYRESAAILDQLWQIRFQLRDGQMRQLLDFVIEKNRSELGPYGDLDWRQWLIENLGEAD